MAPNKAIIKMRAAAQAANKVARVDRLGDYAVTQDRINAIYSNLATTQKTAGRALSASNARQLQAIQRLGQRSLRNQRGDLATGAADATRLYGSALSGAVSTQLTAAKAAVKGNTKAQKAAAVAGQQVSFGAQQAQGIMNAGAAEAQAAAQYASAQALSYRAKQDAQLQADRAMQIQQMKLQAQLQYQTWKKQQDYLAKKEQTGGANLQGISAVADSATTSSAFFRNELAQDPTKTVTDLVADYSAKYGILDQNEQTVLMAVARATLGSVGADGQTKDGYTRADEVNSILDALHILYPNFKGQRKDLFDTIASGLNAYYSDSQAAQAAAGGSDVRHNVSTAGLHPGDQVRGPLGDIGYVQDDGTIKWLS